MNDFFSDLFYNISKVFIIIAAIGMLIGLVLGTALCMCQGLGAISIGWFWATFPFWCPWTCLLVMAGLSAALSEIE